MSDISRAFQTGVSDPGFEKPMCQTKTRQGQTRNQEKNRLGLIWRVLVPEKIAKIKKEDRRYKMINI
jgi:hypothetical protein